jgi:hypothetical protein
MMKNVDSVGDSDVINGEGRGVIGGKGSFKDKTVGEG